MMSRPCSRSFARWSSMPFSTSGAWPCQLSSSATTRSGWRVRKDCVGVAGESLVGHVRVVLERADVLGDVDVPPRPTPGQRGPQLRCPGGCVHERGEVDVVGHPALLEVGAVAGDELGAGPERGLRPVVERALNVGTAGAGDRLVGAR